MAGLAARGTPLKKQGRKERRNEMKFNWSCGCSFEYEDEEALEMIEAGVASYRGGEAWCNQPCLDCAYPEHAPVEGVCECCGKPMALTVGWEFVCDDCLPRALVRSLERIAAYAAASRQSSS